MPSPHRHVSFEPRSSLERLPDFCNEGALIVRFLHASGQLEALEPRLRVYRQGGYPGLDIFLFFLFYFAASLPVGLQEFDDRISPHRACLAAVAERRSLPSHASVSRFLASVQSTDSEKQEDCFLMNALEIKTLVTHPCVQHRDGLGQAWHVFDLDPTSTVLRQRALPSAENLPEGRRRTHEARPGYVGRKRGEVKVSRTTLQHAGSGLWMGIWTAPGSDGWRTHSKAAIDRVLRFCQTFAVQPERVLIRVDGAGGNIPFIAACQEASVPYLTRLRCYQLLESPSIRHFLNEVCWYEVDDSLSGPRRSAAELGVVTLPAGERTRNQDGKRYRPVSTRVVVSRYHSEKERGAGYTIGDWQYELFGVGVEPEALPAPEVVTAYYGRSGQENRFAQEDRELGLDRLFSYHIPGQHLANLYGLFVWNLRVLLGFRLVGAPPLIPPQLPQELRRAQEFALLPLPETTNAGPLPGESASSQRAQQAPETNWVQSVSAETESRSDESDSRAGREPPNAVHEPTSPPRLPDFSGNPSRPPQPGRVRVFAPRLASSRERPKPRGSADEHSTATLSLPPEQARLHLLEELRGLDWNRLPRAEDGWHFVPEDGEVECPNGSRLRLMSAGLLPHGRGGLVRFRPPNEACLACQRRSSSLRKPERTPVREIMLGIPAEVATRLRPLLEASRAAQPRRPVGSTQQSAVSAPAPLKPVIDPPPRARIQAGVHCASASHTAAARSQAKARIRRGRAWNWTRPDREPVAGPFKPRAAVFLPSVVRHWFSKVSLGWEVRMSIHQARAFEDKPVIYAETPAVRQHRRLDWTRRSKFNELSQGTGYQLQFQIRAG